MSLVRELSKKLRSLLGDERFEAFRYYIDRTAIDGQPSRELPKEMNDEFDSTVEFVLKEMGEEDGLELMEKFMLARGAPENKVYGICGGPTFRGHSGW